MTPKTFRHCLLAFSISSLMIAPAFADETADLGTLKVTTNKKTTQGKLGERIISRQQLTQENIQNAHDLVRYNTEVDVAEVGRYGNKGFAVRGVDGNRVAMNIDGVALPDVEVNEIFSPYGYQYEGRFNPDVEMMGGVRITAGADSVVSGSGAVGGAVSYSTKEPYHLVRGDKSLGGYAKLGYTSKNEEKLASVGLAGIYGKSEFLLNYARREGSELKNHNMRSADKSRLDPLYMFAAGDMPYNSTSLNNYDGKSSSLIYPNPLSFQRNSVLAKLYYNLNDSHRVGLHTMHQEQKNHMNVESSNINSGTRLGTLGGGKYAYDVEKMQSYGVNYQFTPSDSNWLDTFNADYTHSKTLGVADTRTYDRTINANNTAFTESKISEQDYRPTETTIDQVSLKLKVLPFDFGKFGQHAFSFNTNYAKQDYTSTARFKYVLGNPTDALKYAFPDAKKDISNISLMDSIYFSDRLKAMVGVRYDNYKYSPYYQNANEHKSITDICTNTISRWWNSEGAMCQAYRADAGLTDADAGKWNADNSARQAWREANYGKYTGLKKTKFDNITWGAGVEYGILPNKLTARYKIGTGFLAPTTNQIYSNFSFNGNHQIPNYNLKPEKSLNQELEFDWQVANNINLTAGGYVSKYKDFIHTKYWRYDPRSPYNNGCTNGTCLQSINLDTAQVYGVKLGVEADLSKQLNSDGKFNVFANFHTAKDSATIETDKDGKFKVNTLAAVPTSLLLGGTYTSADDRWQLNARVNYTQRKKADDVKEIKIGTQIVENARVPVSWATDESTCVIYADGTWINNQCYRVQRSTTYNEYAGSYDQIHRSKSVFVYDLYGTAKFGKDKNWIVNAGVYNLTNQKYIPWETLRQFANSTANSMVDRDGHGFNRYTAPGRNYALSLTYEF